MLEHHLRFEQGRGGERRRVGFHQHLAEIDIFRVGVLGVHGRAAASGLHELGRHVQASVLGLENRPHMRETCQCARGSRPSARRPFLPQVRTRFSPRPGSGFLSMIKVRDLSLPFTSGGTRTVRGTRDGIERRDRRIENDLAILRLNGAVTEIRLLQRRPDVLLGAGRCGHGKSDTATPPPKERYRHDWLCRASIPPRSSL